MALKFYSIVAERLRLKVRKLLWKNCWGGLLAHPILHGVKCSGLYTKALMSLHSPHYKDRFSKHWHLPNFSDDFLNDETL